jgi:hypothetical protein
LGEEEVVVVGHIQAMVPMVEVVVVVEVLEMLVL